VFSLFFFIMFFCGRYPTHYEGARRISGPQRE